MKSNYRLKIPAMVGEDVIVEVISETEADAKREGLAIVKAANSEFVKKGNIKVISIEAANDESQQLAVVPEKSLAELMAVPSEIPTDFFDDEKWINEANKVADIAATIVHEDEKQCSESAANLRKYKAWIERSRKQAYTAKTALIAGPANAFMALEKSLETIAANYKKQFEAAKALRIAEIKKQLVVELLAKHESLGVEFDFRKAVLPEAKETMLTEKGALKSAVVKNIADLAQADKNWQVEIESRVKDIKLACHERGISTTFDAEMIGPALYDKDKAVFQSRLDRLIELDAERVAKVTEKVTATVTATVTESVKAVEAAKVVAAPTPAIAPNAPEVNKDELTTISAAHTAIINSEPEWPMPELLTGTAIITVMLDAIEVCPKNLYPNLLSAKTVMTFEVPCKSTSKKDVFEKGALGMFSEEQRSRIISILVSQGKVSNV